MRVALISDIHGNRWALEAVLAHAAAHGVDAVWNLGDILSGPLDAAATADRLIALDLVTIGGNHERQLLACADGPGIPSDAHAFATTTPAHRAWLRALPALARPRPDVLLCHGTPDSDVAPLLESHDPAAGGLRPATTAEIRARLGDAAVGLVACGHTHLPRVVQLGARCLVVNPGSVGLQAYDYAEDGVPYYVETGAPEAAYAIVDDAGAGWAAQLFRVPYDPAPAAALAAHNARPEWAHALRTGRALRA